jgi:hypothetical protein
MSGSPISREPSKSDFEIRRLKIAVTRPDLWDADVGLIGKALPVIASSAPASGRSPWMKRLSDCRKFRPDFWLKIGTVSSLFPYKISPAKSTW